MRIAGLIDTVSRNAGGLNSSVRRLAQSMSDLGDEIRFVTVADARTEEDLPAWSPLTITIAKPIGPRRFGYAPQLWKLLSAFESELVMVHGIWNYISYVSLSWHRRTGRPVIIHPHGMLDPWAVRNSQWKKRLVGWAFEYEHLRRAACLRALCGSEAQAMRDFGLKNPIAVIPNGIDLTEVGDEGMVDGPAADDRCQGKKLLLYLGRLHPKKGLVHLLRAWAQIRDSAGTSGLLEGWVLAIAGWDEGGHEEELQRLCTELRQPWRRVRSADPGQGEAASHGSSSCSGSNGSGGLAGGAGAEGLGRGGVLFLGPRFGGEKAACYRACHAFILPSFSEGLPMVVLEAWAYGKPVLMTAACNLPEGFAVDAAIRIEPEAGSIAEGLRQLLQASDAEREAMGRNGRALVRDRFTWPQVAAQMRAVYSWVLGGGSPPDCVVMR